MKIAVKMTSQILEKNYVNSTVGETCQFFLLNVALNLKNERFCFCEGSGKSGLPDEVTVFK